MVVLVSPLEALAPVRQQPLALEAVAWVLHPPEVQLWVDPAVAFERIVLAEEAERSLLVREEERMDQAVQAEMSRERNLAMECRGTVPALSELVLAALTDFEGDDLAGSEVDRAQGEEVPVERQVPVGEAQLSLEVVGLTVVPVVQ